MHPNEDLILKFYTAFQDRDFVTMQNSYHSDAKFSDPVFPGLSSKEVKAMWQMLITSAKALRIDFQNISANDTQGRCQWQAWYPFSKTGRKVHNVITATFEFKDGKIVRHHDDFDFWRWSRMALGIPGVLLGWSPIIRNKVQQTAAKQLAKFIAINQ